MALRETRLTIRPRVAAGVSISASAQRFTFLYSRTLRTSAAVDHRPSSITTRPGGHPRLGFSSDWCRSSFAVEAVDLHAKALLDELR
jgi:hypothetical protein